MKSVKILSAISLLLVFAACSVQIKNAKTEIVKINGNCGMCKSTIEKAGNVNNVAQVSWNKDTKMATITYDPNQTNQNEILKRIALAGYDNNEFLAPDDVYANLPECCQYDRVSKLETAKPDTMVNHSKHDHAATTDKLPAATQEVKPEVKQEIKQQNHELKEVFLNYFAVKDALVKSDGNLANSKVIDLHKAVKSVKMGNLSEEEHTVWMKVMKNLVVDIENMEKIKDVEKLRDSFDTLSENIYQLHKASNQDYPTYYQHCPMAFDGKGANWLSKEKEIRNPYFGSTMLSCGKTVETLK
jgi:copper chaperone CopZ